MPSRPKPGHATARQRRDADIAITAVYEPDRERCGRALLALLDGGTRETLVRDDELDPDQKATLVEFTSPRVALDGSLVWPTDEVDSCRD